MAYVLYVLFEAPYVRVSKMFLTNNVQQRVSQSVDVNNNEVDLTAKLVDAMKRDEAIERQIRQLINKVK